MTPHGATTWLFELFSNHLLECAYGFAYICAVSLFSVILDGLCYAFDFASLFLLAPEDFLNNVDKKE